MELKNSSLKMHRICGKKESIAITETRVGCSIKENNLFKNAQIIFQGRGDAFITNKLVPFAETAKKMGHMFFT